MAETYSLRVIASCNAQTGTGTLTAITSYSGSPATPETGTLLYLLDATGQEVAQHVADRHTTALFEGLSNQVYSIEWRDNDTMAVLDVGGATISCGPAQLAIANLVARSPVAPATTGSVDADAYGGTGPYFISLDSAAATPLTGTAIHYSGLAVGAHTLTLTDSAGASVTASFTIAAAGVLGCTTPRALNYDPNATQDDTPTLCVFVDVPTGLSELMAAHLPIPVVVRASPTLAGLASIVVLYLETADSPAGPWVQFARLRQVCDTDATARFDLSEAAKSLLRLRPPVESGTDTSLSALLRARYEILDPTALTPAYAGDAGACRVLNAVVQSSSGAALTTPTPYTEVPNGARLWASVATYAGGVTTTPLALPSNGCLVRQFVWLNAKGAWDSGFFFGRHVHGTDQADPIAFRDLAGADRYAKRGTVRPTLQVYSDKLDWATFRAIRGVRDSIQVWERLGPDEYAPVLVATESYQEYQEVTDKTYQVNFTVSYGAQLIQTQ